MSGEPPPDPASAPPEQPDADDIRDIRGAKAVPGAFPMALIILGAVLFVALTLLLWFLRRRAQNVRELTLSEQTLRRLEALRPLMQPATAREFGVAVSEIVRSYIEMRFHVVATQRTTEEFLQSLIEDAHAALTHHRALLADFLEKCDLVKFAGESLGAADMESLYASARKFVLETAQVVDA